MGVDVCDGSSERTMPSPVCGFVFHGLSIASAEGWVNVMNIVLLGWVLVDELCGLLWLGITGKGVVA